MGSTGVANVTNSSIEPDGTVHLVWDWQVQYVRGNLSDGSSGTTVYVGSGQKPDVTHDTTGLAHIVWVGMSGDTNFHYTTVNDANQVQNSQILKAYTAIDYPEPTVAAGPDDEVHIVFADAPTSLYYMHGTPGNFSTPEVIFTDALNPEFLSDPEITVDGDGRVHLVYIGPSYSQVRYAYRDLDGTWSSSTDVAQGVSFTNVRPAIAVDSKGFVHIAFNGASPWHCRYTNNRSGSFIVPVQCDSAGAGISNGRVGVTCDRDGNAYVIWYGGSPLEVSMAMYDTSNIKLQETQLSENASYDGAFPAVASVIDPCYSSDVSVLATWKTFPGFNPPQIARIQTDY